LAQAIGSSLFHREGGRAAPLPHTHQHRHCHSESHRAVVPSLAMKLSQSAPMELDQASRCTAAQPYDIDAFLRSLRGALLKQGAHVDPCSFTMNFCKRRANVLKLSQAECAQLLCDAALHDDTDEVYRLLNARVDPRVSDIDHRTALHVAAEEGNLSCVKILVEASKRVPLSKVEDGLSKADLVSEASYSIIDVVDRFGMTPLTSAEANLKKDVVEYLLANGAQGKEGGPGNNHEQTFVLCNLAARGDLDSMRKLLQAGAQADCHDYDFRTPLHLASEEGHADCVALLLDRKANINCQDRWGHTPLSGALGHQAAGHNTMDVISLLQARGGQTSKDIKLSPSVTKLNDALGGQPSALLLCEAAADGDVEGVASMLQAGVVPDVGDYDERCALHLACEEGHFAVVKVLVEFRADVNVVDRWGTTPLKGAEQNSHFHIANYIRDHGARATGTSQEPQSLELKTQTATNWWERKLCRLGGLPASSDTVPLAVLEGVLADEYGFDLERHQILRDELEQLARSGRNSGPRGTDSSDTTLFDTPGASPATAAIAGERYVPPERTDTAPFGFEIEVQEVDAADQKVVRRQDFLDAVLCDCQGYKASSAPPCGISRSGTPRSLMTSLSGPVRPGGRGSILARTVLNTLAIGNWLSFKSIIRNIYDEVFNDVELSQDGSIEAGENAQYIPELRDAPSDRLAIAICTVDGQMCDFGDSDEYYSVQSTGKSFAYTLAMKQHTRRHKPGYEGPEGAHYVHQFVGQEPSGRAFNSFDLTLPDKHGICHPFNPVTNAGAIVTCSMIDEDNALPVVPGDGKSARMEARMQQYKAFLSALSGGMEVTDCMDVFASERDHAFNNYALANFMRARNTFPPHIVDHSQLREAVDFYIRICSTKVNTKMLAAIAGSYATMGTSPLTGQESMTPTEAKQTLQMLMSCGMYDFSGEWACTVGMPAKSGVSGNILIVVPGMLGMCVWSPRLDRNGNSVRGVRMAQRFKSHMSCSVLDLLHRSYDCA